MGARYGLQLITPPALEPVTLQAAKTHCRVVISDDDALLTTLIAAARRKFEEATYRQLLTAKWKLSIDRFPPGRGLILLPRPPLQSVTEIRYTAISGVSTVLDPARYQVSGSREPARIIPAPGQIWPIVAWQTADAVQITYTAGYGAIASDVPELIVAGIKLLIGAWYEHREQILAGASVAELPTPIGVVSILSTYDVGDELSEYAGRHTDLPEYDVTRRQLNELGYY